MDMKYMSVEDLAALTASNAPAPGGGSISAMAGAFGAALASMVANLTVGREKFAGVEAEMHDVIEKTGVIYREMLDDMQRDTSAFDLVMAAMKMPKNTDAEKQARSEKMQQGYKAAIDVPFTVAQKAASILPLVKIVIETGNKNAVTDGLVAGMMARTAVLGALYNVRINLASVKDADYVADMTRKCRELQDYAEQTERDIRALAPELND